MEARSGEEFRDDVHKKLPLEICASLTARSPLKSTLAILQTFGLRVLSQRSMEGQWPITQQCYSLAT